jgi:hypothetical protein
VAESARISSAFIDDIFLYFIYHRIYFVNQEDTMKLEPNLIKAILEWGEDNLPERRGLNSKNLEIGQYSSEKITFHIQLLYENGYLDCIDASSQSGNQYLLKNLTMNGYQYLYLLKGKAWIKAKGIMKDIGVIFVESAIKAVIDKTLSN